MEELPDHLLVPVELTVLGARIRGGATVPIALTPLEDLLPVFRKVTDAIVAVSSQSVEQHGGSISCRKGCGACCRQAVPVALPEARRLRQVVDAMPELRRSEVLAAFAAAEQRVQESGLMNAFLEPEALDRSEAERAPMAYFRLGIPCPFLVEESCGIYEERPLACREYMVTSPAAYCAAPDQRVVSLRMPLRASEALARLEGTQGRRYVRQIPLTLSLKWCREHDTPASERSGADSVREFVAQLEQTRPEEAAE